MVQGKIARQVHLDNNIDALTREYCEVHGLKYSHGYQGLIIRGLESACQEFEQLLKLEKKGKPITKNALIKMGIPAKAFPLFESIRQLVDEEKKEKK